VPEAAGSPSAARLARPAWLDARLVLGVLLVLVSVVVGARALAAADRSQLVWATASDLAAGVTLTADDLVASQVRLFGSGGGYLPARGDKPVGYVLDRAVGAGELLPRSALMLPEGQDDLRQVSVPVLPGHVPPDLARGEQVDVWSTPSVDGGTPAGERAAASRLVLPSLTVQQPMGDGGALGASAERSVVLVLRPGDVGTLLSATALGRLDLVRVPSGSGHGGLAHGGGG
jgi:hypothetical protein